MSPLQVTAVPAFEDNYLWLIHGLSDPRRVVVVDPGDASAIEASLKQHGWQLAGILVTHHHGDHVGGVAALQTKHRVPLYGPKHEAIPGTVHAVGEDETVEFAELGLRFRVLDVPGHTAGHVAYVGHGALFCGDTLFSAGCGRLLGGSAQQMTASLGKLNALPGESLVYCAHEYTLSNLRFAAQVEPDNAAIGRHRTHCEQLRQNRQRTVPTRLDLERQINPFLRLSAQSVTRAAARQAGRSLHSDVDRFAVLREWKNQFRG